MEALENVGTIFYELGTFEGFSFRDDRAIERTLSAQEVVDWDHCRDGEAEFWPSGDHAGVALVFKDRSAVMGSELGDLSRLLHELGGDCMENFARIYYAIAVGGGALSDLSGSDIEDHNLHIFIGSLANYEASYVPQ